MTPPVTGALVGRRLAAVLALFGIAYFLSLFFRSVNAILAPVLERDLGLGPSALGLLTATYFLGLGLMQVPIGLCLDAYGPRRVQASLLVIAAAGIGLFAIGEDVAILSIARALIGIGLGGCLMAAFHAAALWLAPERAPFANGLYLAAGGLGTLAATAPVDLALMVMDWRTLFAIIAAATLVLAGSIARVVPDPPVRSTVNWGERIAGIATVVRNPAFGRYLPLTALTFATGSSMQGLWASAWLRDVGLQDREAVALTLTAMAVALTAGSAAGGWASLVAERVGLHLRHVVLGSAGLFLLAQAGLLLSSGDLSIAFWILFALTYNAVTLSYALVARGVPVAFVGRSNSCMNTVVILSTFAVQYGLGVFFGLYQSEATGRIDTSAFPLGLGALFLAQLAAFAWALLGARRG
ncbi:MFS transporter [Acuticoccus sp. M5D2P5]|uniref:MFS transporter n=1 Tax=Acuticoccus kalidii TaxID=2910977 RepID=UPI001F3A1941|nr:MFS transporter [Acuticoccus kalidii]MCF3933255.1 MFS transporter [Acuticoccus kalidii]